MAMNVGILLDFGDQAGTNDPQRSAYLLKFITLSYPDAQIIKNSPDHLIFKCKDPVRAQIELCRQFGYDRVSLCSIWDARDDEQFIDFARSILRKGDSVELAIRPLSDFDGNATDIYYRLSSRLMGEFHWLRFDETNAVRVIQVYVDKEKMYGELYGCFAGGGMIYGSTEPAISVLLGDPETYAATIAGIRAGFSMTILHPYFDDAKLRISVFKAWQLARKTPSNQLDMVVIREIHNAGDNYKPGISTNTIIDAIESLARKVGLDVIIYGGTIKELAYYKKLLNRFAHLKLTLLAPNITGQSKDLYEKFKDDEDYRRFTEHVDWANIPGDKRPWRSYRVTIEATEMGWHQALDRLGAAMNRSRVS